MAETDRGDFLLTVLTGPNAGASAPLGAGRTVIGGAPDDAVILDGVAAGQLSITLHGERARLLAREPGTRVGPTLADTDALHPGAARIVELPAMVRLTDDTLVNIARRTPAKGRRLAVGTAALMAALALTGGLLVGLQIPPGARVAADMSARAATYPQADAEPAPAAMPEGNATTALTATSPQIDPCTERCQRDAADGLSARLAAAGLGSLAVTPADGVLRVTGALPPDRQSEWVELRRRFESDYGRSLPLVVATRDEAAAPLLAVASIWLGSRPEVLTKAGQTLRIGDTTADGWTVARIAKGRITLTRDGAEVGVNF